MGLMDGITNSFTSMTQGLAFAYKAMFGASSDQRLIDGFRDGTRGAPNHPFITNPYAPPYQNPESLDSYGRETGVMREEYQRFYASEPSLQSAIDGKVAAIASLDVSVLPQDEKSEADKRVAEFVREAVKNCPGGWSGLISNILMPSFVNGFSVTEKWLGGIDSEPCFDRLRPKYAGLWSIRRLAQIDTNYIKFQLDNTKQVIGVINTKLGLIGYSPDRVMIYSHRSIFENPYGRSDIRAAYRSCQLIENAYKLWYIALKNYSAPFMKVKTKATGASFSKLKDALAAARAGGWITLSQDDDADLLNFASATSWQAFERKVIMARQEIYLAIRGSYLPFLEGGEQDARGDTQVHKVSSDAIESLIVNSVCEVINHQLVPDLVRPNFGDRVGLPSVSLGGTNWNETKAQLEVVKTVEKELGRPVSTAFIYKVSQLEPPRDDTDGPPPSPAPIQPQGPQSGGFPFHEQLVNKFAEWLGSQAKDRGASKFSDVTSYQYADAFIENADGKVLILKRNTNDDFQPGAWCLPGGKIEPGESPLQAIQREVKEETGLTDIEFKQFAAYFNQDGSTSYAFSGSVSGLDPVVLDPDEHTEHEWLADTRKGYPRIRFMLETKKRLDDYFNTNKKTFAGPPGSPPRPGLVWKEETKRWVRPEESKPIQPSAPTAAPATTPPTNASPTLQPKQKPKVQPSDYKEYKTGNTAEKELAGSSSQWADATNDYFSNMAIKQYAGTSESFQINKCLRTNSDNPQLKDKAAKLAAVLDKTSFPIPITAHRSITVKTPEDRAAVLASFTENVGKEFTDKAFVSTTANKQYADDWAKKMGSSEPIRVEIMVPKGAKAAYLPKDIVGKQEWEVLIQKGSKFKVHSVEGNNVKLELMP